MTQREDAEPAQDGRVIASHGRDALVLDDAGESVPCRLEGRRLAVVCGDRVRWVRGRGEGAAAVVTGQCSSSSPIDDMPCVRRHMNQV